MYVLIINFKQAKHKCTVEEALTFAARFFAIDLDHLRSPPWCNLVAAPFGHRLIIWSIALIPILKFSTWELILASLFKFWWVSVYCGAAYQKQCLTCQHLNILKRASNYVYITLCMKWKIKRYHTYRQCKVLIQNFSRYISHLHWIREDCHIHGFVFFCTCRFRGYIL